MANERLSRFIDNKFYPVVFTTEELLNNSDLPYKRQSISKGDIIFQADECHPYTYHLASGLVRLYLTSSEGAVKTLFYHSEGTQFAFQGFKRDRKTKSTAEAITDCELFVINTSDLIAFCDDHTEYYMAYIEYLFSIMSSQTEEIASLSFHTGLSRVVQLLYVLAEHDGDTIAYSIDELAEIVGAHRNTVSNALAHLRKLGLIEKQPRPIVVRDKEGLQALMESSAGL